MLERRIMSRAPTYFVAAQLAISPTALGCFRRNSFTAADSVTCGAIDTIAPSGSPIALTPSVQFCT